MVDAHSSLGYYRGKFNLPTHNLVIFNRLFLFAAFALAAFAPLPALSADKIATAETLALNRDLTPQLETTIPASLSPPAPSASTNTSGAANKPAAQTDPAKRNGPPAPITSAISVSPAALLATSVSLNSSVLLVNTATSNPSLITDTNLAQSDLWQRIRSGFAMPDLDNDLVAHHERWYASHPDYVTRMTERSQRYLYFIVQEVQKRGMPMEIALLPMIESGFNPDAYSVSRASGIWQFIPSTGKKYGMDQNWWYDGRRDIINATTGALDYLQKLHDQFGDWELALAAYNCGEGAVQRAQERNRKHHKPDDYQHLNLPLETRNYVPKLLAVKNIVSNPEKFGLTLQPVANRPYFTTVAMDRHMDVKLVAQLAEISMEEFSALNPAHDRPVMLHENSEELLLPVDKVDTFRTNLENYDKPLVSWQGYKSQKGERLDKIASRFGLSPTKLKTTNGIPPREKSARGQTLLVPLNGKQTDSEFEAFNTNLPPSLDYSRTTIHIVRRGETLSSIARRYHMPVAELRHMNHNSARLRVGQQLALTGVVKPQRLASRGHIRRASIKGRRLHTRRQRPLDIANR